MVENTVRNTVENTVKQATAAASTIDSDDQAAVLCRDLVRVYAADGIEVQALQGLSLRVDPGEFVAIVGVSGSGKSTLLSILSGIDQPTAGTARVAGQQLVGISRADRVDYQRFDVGFIWQQTARNLLPYLTAAENIGIVLTVAGHRRARHRIAELLELTGATDEANKRPAQMSGGQQQRVAIAVALANNPKVLLADEPTGELDDVATAEVLGTLRSVNRQLGTTTLIVTHDAGVSEHVDRTIQIRDGRIASETLRYKASGPDGRPRVVSENFAVVDRVGRMQLPPDMVRRLGLRERVRLEQQSDHLAVYPRAAGFEATPGGRHGVPAEPDDLFADARPGSQRQEQQAQVPQAPEQRQAPHPDSTPLLVATDITRVFGSDGGDVVANDQISLTVRPGELVVVAGPSGAGKTTLLNILAGLDRPTSGSVTLADNVFAECSESRLAQLRREYIGYVFQSFGLLPMLSAQENVEVPLRLQNVPAAERDERVLSTLAAVGLQAHLDQRPGELSGGQQQRVSLARALVTRPNLLLADEPTGQLDSATAGTVIDLMADMVHRLRIAAVVVTHDELLMSVADRVVHLRDGRVVQEGVQEGMQESSSGRHAQ